MSANYISGQNAIDFAADTNSDIHNYATPVDDAERCISLERAEDLASEDPSLVYVELTATEAIAHLLQAERLNWELIERLGGDVDDIRAEAARAGDHELVRLCDEHSGASDDDDSDDGDSEGISIIDGDSNTICEGLQPHNWRASAERIAAERGEDVLVHGVDDDDDGYSIVTPEGEWRALNDDERANLGIG